MMPFLNLIQAFKIYKLQEKSCVILFLSRLRIKPRKIDARGRLAKQTRVDKTTRRESDRVSKKMGSKSKDIFLLYYAALMLIIVQASCHTLTFFSLFMLNLTCLHFVTVIKWHVGVRVPLS